MKPTNDTAAYIASLIAMDKTTIPPGGGERFNNLIFARSPYLLQHAENPVNWYEWGTAAFDRARKENLPILLSIGYATCHWCHVMAHESFEDNEVALLLNRHFICIKVDREERPDIDDFYMAVSQTLTGSGGWPLNIFMTPEKRPFMATTYLPKRGRGGMSGLMELSANISTIWRQRPDIIEKNCQGIMDALKLENTTYIDPESPDLNAVTEKALKSLKKIYDPINGGFGTAPKFPMPIYLNWLLGQRHSKNAISVETEVKHINMKPHFDEEALNMALHTVKKMRFGGIWDQLGGGLHRYAVDSIWFAPHFEKMLYDQAMLAMVTINAYLATGEQFYKTMTEELFVFVTSELLASEGAFCSALDADSGGGEGKFYIWKKGEIDKCLTTDSELFCSFYGVTDEGNFEEQNILTAKIALDQFCLQNTLNYEVTNEIIKRCRIKLLACREQRIRPLRDDKIITSWNGLMISSLAKAGIVYSTQKYIDTAVLAARFLLNHLRREDGRLLRSYLNGASDIPAFLEDYSFLAEALLDLYEATLDQKWLHDARYLSEDMPRLFRLSTSGEFTLTGYDAEQMPTRVASDHDGVTPSALATAAHLFYRLAWIDQKPELLEFSHALLDQILNDIVQNPLGHLGALQLLTQLESHPAVATFFGTTNSPEAIELNSALQNHAIKNLIIRSENSDNPFSLSLCISGTCYPPASTVDELNSFLKI